MDVYHNKMDELSLNLRLQQALEQNNNVLDLPVSAHETSGGDDFKYEELDDDGDDDDEGGDGDDDDGAQGDDTVYDHVGRVSQKLAGTPPLPNSPSCELLPWLHDITPEHSDLLLDTTGDGIVQRTLPSCNRDAMQLCTENSRALFSVLELCPCWAPLEGGSKVLTVGETSTVCMYNHTRLHFGGWRLISVSSFYLSCTRAYWFFQAHHQWNGNCCYGLACITLILSALRTVYFVSLRRHVTMLFLILWQTGYAVSLISVVSCSLSAASLFSYSWLIMVN